MLKPPFMSSGPLATSQSSMSSSAMVAGSPNFMPMSPIGSFPIVPLTTVLHNTPAISKDLTYLLFGGGASIFGIGLAK